MNIVCVSVRAIQGSNWDDFEIIEDAVEFTRTRAYLILGFGAVSSYFFTIGCLVRFLGFPVFNLKYLASINLYFIGSTNIDDDNNSCIEDGNQSEDKGR